MACESLFVQAPRGQYMQNQNKGIADRRAYGGDKSVKSIRKEGVHNTCTRDGDGAHKSKNRIVEMKKKGETNHIRAHGSGVYTGICQWAAAATRLSSCVQCDTTAVYEGANCELEGGECAGDEGEQPEEGAERDEAVWVPRGIVRVRAALPFEFVCPRALFFAFLFALLCGFNYRRVAVIVICASRWGKGRAYRLD
ncbi:hypothetical protein BC827DRAFT_526545 [Russula dissimulans]|nr:hypothetical protein BC827DRAFT_526545 [Russula dissimulans]